MLVCHNEIGWLAVFYKTFAATPSSSFFFPKDVSSQQGFSKDCWRIISCRSIITIPHISFHYISLQYVSLQSYPINTYHVSIQYVSIQYLSVQCVSIQYVSSSFVSIQYVSVQYACTTRNGNECEYKTHPCIVFICRNGNECDYTKHILAYDCINRNGNEYQIIACHVISWLLGRNRRAGSAGYCSERAFPDFGMHAAIARRAVSFCWMNPLAGFGVDRTKL